MDQGITSDRYRLVPRVLIFITRGAEVLLLRGAPHKRLWANLYNGIGGHVERGEDILTAARRELAEESGLRADNLAPPGLWLCGIMTVDTGEPTGIGLFIFRGALSEAHFTAPLTPSPEGSLEWLQPAALDGLPCLPDLPLLLPRCLAHAPGEPPFFARAAPGPQLYFS